MDLNTRPESGQLAEGDKVLVFEGTWGRPRREAIPAVVEKASRIWLILRDGGDGSRYPRQWRMRRDTQDEGNKQYPQGNGWFVTPEQHEYDERLAAVDAVICDAKVRLDDGWRGAGRVWTPERRIALADLIVSLGILGGGK
jgi:hypothetical protein